MAGRLLLRLRRGVGRRALGGGIVARARPRPGSAPPPPRPASPAAPPRPTARCRLAMVVPLPGADPAPLETRSHGLATLSSPVTRQPVWAGRATPRPGRHGRGGRCRRGGGGRQGPPSSTWWGGGGRRRGRRGLHLPSPARGATLPSTYTRHGRARRRPGSPAGKVKVHAPGVGGGVEDVVAVDAVDEQARPSTPRPGWGRAGRSRR